jgi:hypothetical protein
VKASNSGWIVALALAGFPAAHAWGPDGHHTVAALAEQLIAGSHAAQQVQALLGSLSLQDAAVWADCAKGVDPKTFIYTKPGKYPECAIFETADGEAAMADFVRRNATNCVLKPGEEICHKQYHYADIAIQHMAYQSGWVGARDDDIAAAVAAMTHVLKGDPTPAPFNIKDQAEALRLLAHYVGDIHQPLHVGAVYLDAQGQLVNPDQGSYDPATFTTGANKILLLPSGKSNLHHTWDAIPASLRVARVNAAWVDAARAIPASTGVDYDWPRQWASDSVAEASLAFSGLSFGAKNGDHWTVALPKGYSRPMSAIKKRQLTRAAARFAQLLQDIWP